MAKARSVVLILVVAALALLPWAGGAVPADISGPIEQAGTHTVTPPAELSVCPPSVDFGETIQCSIDAAAETDTFIFDANAGDVVLVRMGRTSGDVWPGVRIHDPVGNEIPGCRDESTPMAEVQCNLTANGTYTILAYDSFNGTLTGTYCLYLQRLNDPGNAVPIGFETTVAGSVDCAAEVDTYTFAAYAGATILVRMGRTSGDVWPGVRIHDPAGSEIPGCRDESTPMAEVQCNLTADGTYTILAYDSFDGTLTGGYDLQLTCLSEPPCGPPPPGDVDCDGKITIVDALLIAQLVVGLIDALDCPENADVDEDGEVGIVDALLIAQKVVGLI